MSSELIEQLAAPENLLAAWRAVRGNIPKYRRERSAGPDGVTLTEFERDLPTQLNALHDMLLSGRYTPQPPARFVLSKRDGGRREIAVLSVVDRVAQRAAQQVLEPLWEPEFLECSFGFRPGLSIDDAVACAQGLRARDQGWAVDGDIASCFNSLDHDLLVARLRRKIREGRVLGLLQKWLDAGVMQAGLPQESGEALTGRMKGAATSLHRGIDWAITALAQESDPYAADRYEMAGDLYESGGADGEGLDGGPGVGGVSAHVRRSALRRLAANGLLLGLTWARPAISSLGGAAMSALKSPAGRRALRKGAWATGGLAGAAAAAAVTAYVLHRKAGPAPTGALQGSPLSPLLANIYLHPFDVMMTRRGHRLVRYADDWVILCPSREAAETAYNDAVRALARLRLKVNPGKTRILAPGERLEWLGAVVR